MNYNYLRYFSVLAQVEHYTLAAARLEISQPSLSSAIHNLENELGIKLFEKVGRNIRLTEQGRYFQKKVDAAMAELTEATQTLRASRESAPIVIRVGYVSGALDGTMAEQIADYGRREKRARFQLTEDSSEKLMDLMRREELDMAIVDTTDRDRSLHFRKLRQRDFYAAVPTGHPLAEYESLSPRMITPYPQIVFNYDMSRSFTQWADQLMPEQTILCQVNTAQAALDLVAAGVGIAVIPDECIHRRSGITYIPLTNWHQALYMCILYDKWLEPPVWDFVELVVKAIRRSAAENAAR